METKTQRNEKEGRTELAIAPLYEKPLKYSLKEEGLSSEEILHARIGSIISKSILGEHGIRKNIGRILKVITNAYQNNPSGLKNYFDTFTDFEEAKRIVETLDGKVESGQFARLLDKKTDIYIYDGSGYSRLPGVLYAFDELSKKVCPELYDDYRTVKNTITLFNKGRKPLKKIAVDSATKFGKLYLEGIASTAYYNLTGDITALQKPFFGGICSKLENTPKGLEFKGNQLKYTELSGTALENSTNKENSLEGSINTDNPLKNSENSGTSLYSSRNSGNALKNSINSEHSLKYSRNKGRSLEDSTNWGNSLKLSTNSENSLLNSTNRGNSLASSQCWYKARPNFNQHPAAFGGYTDYFINEED